MLSDVVLEKRRGDVAYSLPTSVKWRRGWVGAVTGLIGVRVASSLMQFLILVLISRAVTISEFGGYSAAIGIGAVLSGIFGFGFLTRALRIGAESTTMLATPMVLYTVVASVLVAVIVYGYALVSGGPQLGWALAGAVYVASEMINGLAQSILFGEERSRRAEVLIILRRAIPLSLVLGALAIAPAFMFEIASAGFLVSAAVGILLLGRQRWGGWQVKETFGGSRQYWFTNIWSMLQQLDTSIVGALAGFGAAGGYGAAFRLASPVHLVTSSLTSLMIPRISKLASLGERSRTAQPFVRAAVFYAFFAMAVSPLAGYLGPLFFGREFEPYSVVFTVFFINSAISVLNQTQAARLYGEGAARTVTVSTAIGTVTGLALVCIGAVAGGAVWAAIGFASSRALLSVLLAFSWRRLIRKKPNGEDNNGLE